MRNPAGSLDTVLRIDHFLSARACAALLEELQFTFWRPSTVVRLGSGKRLIDERSDSRVSETTTYEWFNEPLRRKINAIERRLERVIPGMRDRYELWQATRYHIGGRFDFHYDCGHWADEPA